MIPDRQPDLFKRLRPIYGAKIDALWLEYQTADPERRREIETILNLIAMKRLGLGAGEDRLLLEPPPESIIRSGEYFLGHVSYPGLAPYGVWLRRQELLRHMFILGPTGTGKSTLIIGLLTQFLDDGTPFMVFDFKRNYRCLIDTLWGERVLVVTVGRDVAPLTLNALRPPAGVGFEEFAAGLSDIISTSYLLMQGARNVLMEALLRAYKERGDDATIKDAYQLLDMELRSGRAGSRRYGWLESATRSLDELSKGGFGSALNSRTGRDVRSLLASQVVFELEGLSDDQRRFFCLYFLYAIMQLRKHGGAAREVLHHVLVFDEAHNVFPKEQYGQLGVPSRLAREVREYGEAIIAATQQADVADSLIANSGIKIILRTDYPRDVEFASKLLQVEPKWFPRLPLGTGIMRLPTRFATPFLCTFLEQPIKNWAVSDKGVCAPFDKLGMPRPLAHNAGGEPVITDRERALLADIAAVPIAGITARYDRLGWHPMTGNGIKDSVISKGLARFEEVPTPTARLKILTLTAAGVKVLEEHGVSVPAARRGGAAHEYWRSHLRSLLEREGFAVTEEYRLSNGGAVDLHGTKQDREVFIEVETGKSDIAANIAKIQDLPGRVLVFFIEQEACSAWEDSLGVTVGLTMLDLDHFPEFLG